jgi:SAM-dependent methyltransferase
MDEADRTQRDARWRAEHAAHVREALSGGNASDIKQLYVDMGSLLEESFGDDVAGAPQLSLDETVPVVTSLLAEVEGVILDAGCGPYPTAAIALAQNRDDRAVVGLDLGIGTVRIARARAATDRVPLLAVAGDIEALPFRSGCFDGIVSDDTIEHVPHDRAAMAELVRVGAAGAPIVVATPNRRRLSVLARKAFDFVRARHQPAAHYFMTESHLREYTRRELDQLVRGLAIVERRASVGWDGRGLRRIATALTASRLLRGLDRMLVVRMRGTEHASSQDQGA